MAKKRKKSKLVGFARLKVTDPEKFKAISARAGKRAQKLHGKAIRWTKAEAKAMAKTGGKAVQKQYRKQGHPLQIAQAKREARAVERAERIKVGRRKKKAAKAPVDAPIPAEAEASHADAGDGAAALRGEPEPEKDVANG